jgi:6-phosphogluconate dehydrogenase
MRIGFVGLGRMGAGMTRRLLRHDHQVVAHDRDPSVAMDLSGAEAAESLDSLVEALDAPRVVWVMVPAGDPTEAVLATLEGKLASGDIIIDGGNANYRDTLHRAERLGERGIHLIDAGTSGGVAGEEVGYCLMVGGAQEAFDRCEPLFASLAPEGGYARVGEAGAGHFSKMVHNGIEYGMLQAYAEGLEILHASEFDFDLGDLARLWNRGSVIRSWMLELVERMYEEEGRDLEEIRGWVDDSGEGRWTVETALDLDVPAPIITLSLLSRFRSRQDDSYAARTIAALRNQFGGHALHKPEEER